MPLKRSANYSQPQQQAPRRRLEYVIDKFGTLNTTDDPVLMGEVDSPDTLNTVYDRVGSVQERGGYTKVLTTSLANPIDGLIAFYKSDATRQLVYGSGTNLYRYDNAGGSVVLTGTPSSFTSNKAWSFDVYQDTVYGGNGVEPLIGYTGSTYSVINSAINPAGVKIHKNRVFAFKPNSSTLYFSDAGSPSSFPANNFIQINTNDGQNITGVEVQQDALVIFKSESIFILTGEPLGAGNTTTIGNLQLRKANSDVGCTAGRTVQRVGSVLFFMHKSGMFVFQNYTSQLISQPLNKTFADGTNLAFIDKSWSVYSPDEKKYILGYPSPTSTVPDKAIVYDLISKSWTMWDNIPGSCAVNYRFSGLTESVVMGDPTKGNIYQLFTGAADIAGDNGTATAGTTTTLTDSTKSWTSSLYVDAKVKIISGTGAGQISTITANTATQLTFSPAFVTAPDTSSVYAIGAINSYWTTKQLDYQAPEMSKKYKYTNIFADSADYPLRVGTAIDFAGISYTDSLNLGAGNWRWDQATPVWDQPGYFWDSRASVFKRSNISGVGRMIQHRFGTEKANQPWRLTRYSTSYKLKKARPDLG